MKTSMIYSIVKFNEIIKLSAAVIPDQPADKIETASDKKVFVPFGFEPELVEQHMFQWLTPDLIEPMALKQNSEQV